MSQGSFNEGVKPGGLTSGIEIRILLCYLLDNVEGEVSRRQIEEVLLGEELVNYFVLAESLGQLLEQGLVETGADGYSITDKGRTVARTLADDVPRTVREAAVRGVIRARQFALKQAAHLCEVEECPSGYIVHCKIADETGSLFGLDLYMPDRLTAYAVRQKFLAAGDNVYKLVLAALTDDGELAKQAIERMDTGKK